MAKGQQRQPKEKKKPKAEDKMKPVSGYKSQYGGGGGAPSNTLGSKKAESHTGLCHSEARRFVIRGT